MKQRMKEPYKKITLGSSRIAAVAYSPPLCPHQGLGRRYTSGDHTGGSVGVKSRKAATVLRRSGVEVLASLQ